MLHFESLLTNLYQSNFTNCELTLSSICWLDITIPILTQFRCPGSYYIAALEKKLLHNFYNISPSVMMTTIYISLKTQNSIPQKKNSEIEIAFSMAYFVNYQKGSSLPTTITECIDICHKVVISTKKKKKKKLV